jgi:hypothetical protein
MCDYPSDPAGCSNEFLIAFNGGMLFIPFANDQNRFNGTVVSILREGLTVYVTIVGGDFQICACDSSISSIIFSCKSAFSVPNCQFLNWPNLHSMSSAFHEEKQLENMKWIKYRQCLH